MGSLRCQSARAYSGVVRGNNAFVYVDMDRAGNVSRIRAKWPTMVSLSKDQGDLFQKRPKRSVIEVFIGAQQYLSSVPAITTNPEKSAKAIAGTLESSALAWIPEEMGGATLIKPGISFIGSLEFEDGTIAHPYADVPLY